MSDGNDEANTNSQRPQGKLQRNTSTQTLQRRLPLNTNIKLQRKLWSGIQVSNSAQRKLHSGMCTSTQGYIIIIIIIILNWSDFGENRVEEVE